MLVRDAMTSPAVTVTPYTMAREALRLLDRLRHEGVARMSGRGRGARWHLTGDDGGDGEEDTDNGHAA